MAKRVRKVQKRDSYSVGAGNRAIAAAVDVGLGQIGTVTMSVGRNTIVDGEEAPLPPDELGQGDDLKGKLLLVEVTVTDVSAMTNKMSVAVRLTGGRTTKKVTVSDEVEEEGDSLFFQVFVLFQE
jgi:hypothetical protein